ncbi:MAG: XdhC family protein [Chloroflexi bacterium]|nr:XdhC family protein [Chloroflexota bacterium]
MGELERILAAAESLDARGEPYSLATVVRVDGSSYRRPGARLLVPREGPPVGLISGGCLEEEAARLARAAIDRDRPMLLKIDHSAEGDELWGLGLGCRGVVHLFAEPPRLARETLETVRLVREGRPAVYPLTGLDGSRRSLSADEAATLADGGQADRPLVLADAVLDPILSPTHLVICGAGPDAVALLDAARRLDWRVTVADPRRVLLASGRFGDAERCDADPSEAAGRIGVTGRTAVVIMSHDYVRDGAYLAGFLGRGAAYVGVLGPRQRTDRLLAEAGSPADKALHAPAGLDIGADGPEEVATAIMAEIVATLHGHRGGPLRDREGPIHGPPVSRR